MGRPGLIVIRNIWLDAPRWVVPAVYISVGWTALVVIPALWSQLGAVTCALLLLGGVTGAAYGGRDPVRRRRRGDQAIALPAILDDLIVYNCAVPR